jgi:hypothetical protein
MGVVTLFTQKTAITIAAMLSVQITIALVAFMYVKFYMFSQIWRKVTKKK